MDATNCVRPWGPASDAYQKNPFAEHGAKGKSPDWSKAPSRATHALWSRNLQRFYFWQVFSGVTYFWQGENAKWQRHKQQDLSRPKLSTAIKRPADETEFDPWDTVGEDRNVLLSILGQKLKGDPNYALYVKPYIADPVTQSCMTLLFAHYPELFPEDQPEPERNTGMNLDNAALLVRDDIKTVSCGFNEHASKEYTYVLHNSIAAQVGDPVIVEVGGHFKAVTVTAVHDNANIDPNSNITYQWIICSLAQPVKDVDSYKATTNVIAEKLKQQQSVNVRDQILRQFGVANVTELLNGPAE